MSGLCSRAISLEPLVEIFGEVVLEDLPQPHNVVTNQQVLVIRKNGEGNRTSMMGWGLIPSWAGDPSIGNRMLYVRCETVHDKPAVRSAIRFRRCVIPANGYFERRGERGRKNPLYVRMKDESIMGFAGIWNHWKTPDDGILEFCSILTTNSNRLLQTIHDRMPVILHPKEYEIWLDRDITDPERLRILYQPYPADLLEMVSVSSLVDTPRTPSDCIRPPQG